MRRLVIRNTSDAELGVVLEPWTDREDVEAGGQVTLKGEFADNELVIDFGNENFLSIWCPAGSTFRKPQGYVGLSPDLGRQVRLDRFREADGLPLSRCGPDQAATGCKLRYFIYVRNSPPLDRRRVSN